MVLFELLEDPLRLFDAESVLDSEIVIQRQVPFRVDIGRHPKLVRILRHGSMAAQIECSEPDGVHEIPILVQKADRAMGLLPCFSREAKESHYMVPDSDAGGQLQTALDHVARRGLVHELQHALVAGFETKMQVAAS